MANNKWIYNLMATSFHLPEVMLNSYFKVVNKNVIGKITRVHSRK